MSCLERIHGSHLNELKPNLNRRRQLPVLDVQLKFRLKSTLKWGSGGEVFSLYKYPHAYALYTKCVFLCMNL